MTRKSLISLCMLATLPSVAGKALAQCDIYWPNIPDLDQKRTPSGSIDGLPGGGDMYCAPVAAVNLMAYISRHGFPFAMTGANGSENWQSNSNYAKATNNSAMMGTLMGTHPVNGTSGGLASGLSLFMLTHGLAGNFSSFGIYKSGNQYPSPMSAFVLMSMGSLEETCYGRYSLQGSQWVRGGGHCVTIQHIFGACTTTPQFGIRNPVASDSTTMQSPFVTQPLNLTKHTRNFGGTNATAWDFPIDNPDGKIRVIDQIQCVTTNFLLCVDPVFGKPKLHFALSFAKAPITLDLDTGNAGPVLSMDFDFTTASAVVITDETGPSPSKLLMLQPGNTPVEVAVFDRPPDWVKTNRHGEVYIKVGNSIERHRIDEGRPVLLNTFIPPVPPDAAAFDDQTDEIVLLNVASRRLMRHSRSGTPMSNQSLPSGFVLTGTPLIDIHPGEHKPFITSTGSPGVMRINVDPASGRLVNGGIIAVNELVRPTGLQIGDNGHLFVLCDGSVREFEQGASGGWMLSPASAFAHHRSILSAGGLFMLRSRTNYDPAQHDNPGWLDIPGGEDVLTGVLDCPADFNLDGAVDFFDYDDYVRCFEGQACPRGRDADFNDDGTVDFFDYDAFVVAFEEGC
ncbi:MAG: hypothetical protein AABZ53_16100 [Planctomycetota bacterium]